MSAVVTLDLTGWRPHFTEAARDAAARALDEGDVIAPSRVARPLPGSAALYDPARSPLASLRRLTGDALAPGA